MILIKEDSSVLDLCDLTFLKEKCDNFITSEEPGFINGNKGRNYYYRHLFDLENEESKGIVDKIIEYVKSVINQNMVDLLGIWINKITNESNQNDDFHLDSSDLTLIIYLNDNFKGGELEYVGEKNRKIKIFPKKNLSIMMDNKISHKVMPVLEGVRFSLVCFFSVGKKKEKTLL